MKPRPPVIITRFPANSWSTPIIFILELNLAASEWLLRELHPFAPSTFWDGKVLPRSGGHAETTTPVGTSLRKGAASRWPVLANPLVEKASHCVHALHIPEFH